MLPSVAAIVAMTQNIQVYREDSVVDNDSLRSMHPELLFSCIIAARNACIKLPETIGSVLAEGNVSVELLVIDGASTDGTVALLAAQNDARLSWISEQDQGVYDAMNKGIALAKGRFLLFLGAGDRLMPGTLERVAEFIETNNARSPRLIYGDVREMQSRVLYTAGRYSRWKLCHTNICHQGLFYEKSIFKLLGGYELTYPIMADWAFNMRCFGNPRIKKHHIPQIIAEFERGGMSDADRDFPFAADRLRLIGERLGPLHALLFRMEHAIRRRAKKLLTLKH
jgi:hypothetical protein